MNTKNIEVKYRRCWLEDPIIIGKGKAIVEGMCMEASDGVLYFYSEVPFNEEDFNENGELIYSHPHYGELKRNMENQISEMGYPLNWFVFPPINRFYEARKRILLKKIEEKRDNPNNLAIKHREKELKEIEEIIEKDKENGWIITQEQEDFVYEDDVLISIDD